MDRLRVLLAAVRDTREVKRAVIRTMVLVDEALDAVLYRPAVVKAFTWAPCEACGRRASIHLVGARSGDCGPEQVADKGGGGALEHRAVHLCGWCHIEGPVLTEKDLERELIAAARDSVAWRWRWRRGRG